MWGALKADFSEFVSVVTTDATEALAAVDNEMDEINGGAKAVGDDSVFLDDGGGFVTAAAAATTSVSDGKEGHDDDDDADADADADAAERKDKVWSRTEMLDYLYTCHDVFLEELESNEQPPSPATDSAEGNGNDDDDDGQEDTDDNENQGTSLSKEDTEYLANFKIEEKTEEISRLLEAHSETLKVTFSELTDRLEYKEFWKRYYFRLGRHDFVYKNDNDDNECNDNEDTDDNNDTNDSNEQEQPVAESKEDVGGEEKPTDSDGKDEILKAIFEKYYVPPEDEDYEEQQQSNNMSALRSVTNFFDGAVKRFVEEAAEGPSYGNNQKDSTGAGINFFPSGRPPFVLNTAVSEDDDDDDDKQKGAMDDDEEEEELGWDDDDDDDDFDDDNVHGGGDDEDMEEHTGGLNRTTGQIEFHDAEKERLQQELEQALLERDSLQKTVQMQADEIKKLQASTDATAVDSSVSNGNNNQELESLKMELFEKDAELAALKARLLDDEEEDQGKDGDEAVAEAKQTIDRLTKDLATKNATLAKTQQELEHAKKNLQQKQQQQDSQLTSAKRDMAELEKKNTSKVTSLEDNLRQLESQFKQLQKDHALLQGNYDTSQSQLSQLQTALQEEKEQNKQLRQQPPPPSSPTGSSTSTGVKVGGTSQPNDDATVTTGTATATTSAVGTSSAPAPSPSLVAKSNDNDDDDDDNDDDGWGDDW